MKSAKIHGSDFNRIIKASKDFVAKGFSKVKAHSYIKLDFSAQNQEVTAIAVDGFKLSVEHSIISECEEDFTVFVKPNMRLESKSDAIISLVGSEAIIRSAGYVFGYEQPECNFMEWQKQIPSSEPNFKIAFDGRLLVDALKSAEISSGFKHQLIMEFHGENNPVVIKTNDNDIKLVMPRKTPK